MISRSATDSIGVLLSGGLDSAILAAHLLEEGRTVQPFYVRCRLAWEHAELASLRRFLQAIEAPLLRPLVTIEMPLTDLYGPHWSITGRGVPGGDTPDEAVFLPGRNALLLLKTALWCQLHGVGQLALASLVGNPFADASDRFFSQFEAALACCGERRVELLRPFARLDKSAVLHMGRHWPLEHTFSCIAPRGLLHCGDCNKCAERKAAFGAAGLADRTRYHGAAAPHAPSHES